MKSCASLRMPKLEALVNRCVRLPLGAATLLRAAVREPGVRAEVMMDADIQSSFGAAFTMMPMIGCGTPLLQMPLRDATMSVVSTVKAMESYWFLWKSAYQ